MVRYGSLPVLRPGIRILLVAAKDDAKGLDRRGLQAGEPLNSSLKPGWVAPWIEV